jgi:hypothetical protein
MSVVDRKVSEVLWRTARAIGKANRTKARRNSGCRIDFAETETESVCEHNCRAVSCDHKKVASCDRLYLELVLPHGLLCHPGRWSNEVELGPDGAVD